MALHDDLLVLGRQILGAPPAPGAAPVAVSQAAIRRAVSTAYYALFHLLLFEATELLRVQSPQERRQLGRGMTHTGMKGAARAVASQGPLALLGQVPFPQEAVEVAQAFVDLQEGRHLADYDVATDFTWTTANGLVAQAETAFVRWNAIRGQDRANLFLHLLGSYENLKKRD